MTSMSDSRQLEPLIEAAFERRAELSSQNVPQELRVALDECVDLLDRGTVRVAEKRDGHWSVNQWLKKAVLLYFRTHDNAVIDAGYARFYDKVPLKYATTSEAEFRAGGARIVPHAIVRKGAYVAADAVLMPSYVNIGAYVDRGSMVDTWVDGRLVRADRQERAPLGRRGDRRGARAAAGDSRPSSRTTASSALDRRSSRAWSSRPDR